ncbi:hypothetical protein [Nocardioides lacusdianchii]|uniref:hypothetical protein n=1 Tax=Nocardioides lacusdianchii TaxID=2783664 RepID=UPI001CC97D77|nr:hypothetical protein [Nocardioides lacusdianchii]
MFVASLNTESDIEQALNDKYAADITFESYRRKHEVTVDGRESRCRVEGDIGNLDDVRLVCTPPEEPPPLRKTRLRRSSSPAPARWSSSPRGTSGRIETLPRRR